MSVRCQHLADQSVALLSNRLTTTVAGASFNLLTVILARNQITSVGMGHLRLALKGKSRHPLTHLDLSDNLLDDECIDDVLGLLEEKGSTLQNLILCGNRFSHLIINPILDLMFADKNVLATLRCIDLCNSSPLLPLERSNVVRMASVLYSLGADICKLGWGFIRSTNDESVFVRRDEGKLSAEEQGVASFDLTHRVHTPASASLLLSLSLQCHFNKGIRKLILRGSGLSDHEHSGFAKRSGLASHAARKRAAQDGRDDEPETFVLRDLLIDFVCLSESLEELDLSENRFTFSETILPLLEDAVRLSRKLLHIDVRRNVCDVDVPEVQAVCAAVLTKNKVLRSITLDVPMAAIDSRTIIVS